MQHYTIILSIIFTLLLAVGCDSKNPDRTTTKPNILFILTDDHALQAISAYDHPISKLAPTPNIDRLANEGFIFSENYSANSIYGPSRASILTGKHSHANGFMKNDGTKFNGKQPTIANILQKNGFQTAAIGKWHLNTDPEGFDYYRILSNQSEYNNPEFMTKDATTQEMGYVTELITDFSKDWLNNRDKNKPFFLMMQHKAPHRNWVPAEKHYRLYENVKFPIPDNYFDNYSGRQANTKPEMNFYQDVCEGHDLKMVTGIGSDTLLHDQCSQVFFDRMTEGERNTFLKAYRERNDDYYLTPRSEKEKVEWKLQRYLQDYLACVKSVDESVGEMYDYLKENDLLNNTIVVYSSDQGIFLGEHGWFDKRWMYEESFKMPLIIRDPFIEKSNKNITELTQNIDFSPTFLDMVNIDVPNDMQGRSFLPLMEDTKLKEPWRKAVYYHYYEFPGFYDVKAHNGVQTDRYKLIHFYKNNTWEMYDLKSDPSEIKNIYNQNSYKQVQKDLHRQLDELIMQYQVPDKYLF